MSDSPATGLTPPDPPADGFRTFLTLWVTQSASLVGSQVTFFALNVWLVQGMFPDPSQRSLLASALGANGLAYALPLVLGQPLGGVWADRHDRRTILIIANLAAAVQTAVLAALLATGNLTLPLMLALMAVYGFTGACHQAAFDTAYVQLVHRDQLPRANAMMATTFGLAGILSPGIAALLIALPGWLPNAAATLATNPLIRTGRGASVAILVDVATFLISALVLTRLTMPPSPRAAGGAHWTAELLEGLRFVFARRALVMFLVLLAAANLCFAFVTVLLPLLAKFELAADSARFGWTFEGTLAFVNTVGGAGGVLGGAVVGVWGGAKRRRAIVVLLGLLLMGAFVIGLGLSSLVLLAALFLALTEFMVPFVVSHALSIWQTLTPHELQGRVLAARRVVALGTFPLGNALAGGLAAATSARTVLLFAGGLLFAVSALLFGDRSLREAGDE